MVHTMNELMVWLEQWRYQTEDDIIFLLEMDKNCSWQLWKGPGGKIDGLGSKIEAKCPLSFGVIQSWWFLCENINSW